MKITSAEFIKGIVGPDESLEEDFPQVAFIGRSNVGKSSIINSLVLQKNLARTSARPGRTQEINLFLINNSRYLLDLPGYGYAKTSKQNRLQLREIIFGYLFDAPYDQEKVVLIIDANVGLKDFDLEVLELLEEHNKNIVIVANKVDKIKKSKYKEQLKDIQEKVGAHKVIPFSVKKNIGREELLKEIL